MHGENCLFFLFSILSEIVQACSLMLPFTFYLNYKQTLCSALCAFLSYKQTANGIV